MRSINRLAVVVIPAQPFLDWMHRADPTGADLTLVDLQLEPTVYLLRESESDEESLRHLRAASSAIFEQELAGWYRDPDTWPQDRSFKNFQRWFTFSLHSMVVDMANAGIEHEEMDAW